MLPGTSLTLLARQLMQAIQAGFVDRSNESLMTALMELRTVLEAYLEPARN
jgi:hypothetical protein